MAAGINVMDLPDAPVKKDPELSDEVATMVYSEQVMNDKAEDKSEE